MAWFLCCRKIVFMALLDIALCICNLGQLQKETASMSSVYRYRDTNIALNASGALDGKFRNHMKGDCAGTNVEEAYKHAWWNITLSRLWRIYKINIIFREDYFRHNGYYVYLNKDPVDISGLASLPAVYRGHLVHPSTQNVILFPEGHQGKQQLSIYLNKSEPEDTDGDEKNNVLDICEVEILGCVNKKGRGTRDIGCACPEQAEYPADALKTEIAFPSNGNSITIQCYSKYIIILNVSSLQEKCNFKKKCTTNTKDILHTIFFQCSEFCLNLTYDELTTEIEDNSKGYYLENEIITLRCKENHKLFSGDLKRMCKGNESWNGEETVCKRFCRNAAFNENTTLVIQRTPHVFVNQNVTYKCKTNHRLVSGDLTRQCLNDSAWTGSQPICKKCQCPCKRTKSQNFIKDNEILGKVIEKRKKKLEVKKFELSSTIRKKTSAPDERKSAQGVGMALGVGLITSVLSIIICSDLPLLWRHIRYGPQPQKRKCRARKIRR
ncbi:uncharacterized protein LOC134236424 [Saccostrea cucullata]|uniref:uncharacterized protein LOC134236424 n=1 Tax=Saccostrea cuccullata TaxID=36930 RepID=UPI002ED0D0A7